MEPTPPSEAARTVTLVTILSQISPDATPHASLQTSPTNALICIRATCLDNSWPDLTILSECRLYSSLCVTVGTGLLNFGQFRRRWN
jgi:hypothetical protein